VIDEVFMDFVENGQEVTLIHEAIERGNLFIIRSLTKFFALPGLRLGYGVGNEGFLQRLWRYKEYWSVNILAQVAGRAALRDREYIARTLEVTHKETEFLYSVLSKINGLKPYPSAVNFILCQITKKTTGSKQLKEKLIQRGVLIRDCSSFRSLDDRYIRITIRDHAQNSRLVALLREVL
jgi:threonine-phosphate decarboxylase